MWKLCVPLVLLGRGDQAFNARQEHLFCVYLFMSMSMHPADDDAPIDAFLHIRACVCMLLQYCPPSLIRQLVVGTTLCMAKLKTSLRDMCTTRASCSS